MIKLNPYSGNVNQSIRIAMELVKSFFLDNIDLFIWVLIVSFLVYLSYCGMENGNGKKRNKLVNKSKWAAGFDFLFRLFRTSAISSFLFFLTINSDFKGFYEKSLNISLVFCVFSFGLRELTSDFADKNNKLSYWICTHYLKREMTSAIILSLLFVALFISYFLLFTLNLEMSNLSLICFVDSFVIFYLLKKIVREPPFVCSNRFYPKNLRYENWAFSLKILGILLIWNPLPWQFLFDNPIFSNNLFENIIKNLKIIGTVPTAIILGFIVLFFGSKKNVPKLLPQKSHREGCD